MRELTFLINPFKEVESERVIYIGENLEYDIKGRDLIDFPFYDFISYKIGDKDGLFTSNNFFLQYPNRRVFGFNCVDYHYILGDVSIFTIKTKKSPNEILKKLKSSLLFFSDENTNKFVFNGIKKIWVIK